MNMPNKYNAPWKFQQGKEPFTGEIRNCEGRLLNHASGIDAKDEADMRLMSAAPELLEALQNAGNVLAALATGQLKTVSRDSSALKQIRAAIAKATS
jgi:hypothetical protein